MLYMFRVEENFMDASVMSAEKKAIAVKVLKRGYSRKTDRKTVFKVECFDYATIVGSKKEYPAPNEIVEIGVVKRYKIKEKK